MHTCSAPQACRALDPAAVCLLVLPCSCALRIAGWDGHLAHCQALLLPMGAIEDGRAHVQASSDVSPLCGNASVAA